MSKVILELQDMPKNCWVCPCLWSPKCDKSEGYCQSLAYLNNATMKEFPVHVVKLRRTDCPFKEL